MILETAPVFQRLGSRFALSDDKRRFLGPLTAEAMLARLDDPFTPHALRATIGDRLALLPGGDPASVWVPTACPRSSGKRYRVVKPNSISQRLAC